MNMINHISHSQIDMWLRCPKQWEYRYIHGIKTPPSGALVVGSCYHKALELNFRQKVHSFKDLPVEECMDNFVDAWDLVTENEEDIQWQGSSPGHLKDQGVALIDKYIDTTAPTVQPVEVEQRFECRIGDTGFVYIMDLLDDNNAVIDHKTSSKMYVQSDVDKSLQASAAAYVLDRPIIFYNHVAVKSARPQIQIVRTIRIRRDIQWWEDLALGVLSEMKSGIAPPRPGGWWCSPKWCGYWPMCRGELASS